MTNWMIAAERLVKGISFDPAEIQEVAKVYGMDLRDGTKELFKNLQSAQVPVLVFSAGLGDVVEAVLRNQGVLFDNVKVISFPTFIMTPDELIVIFIIAIVTRALR